MGAVGAVGAVGVVAVVARGKKKVVSFSHIDDVISRLVFTLDARSATGLR